MALYVTQENQTLLWTIIHKNPLAQQFFLKIAPSKKDFWFKSIIQLFYNQNQTRTLNIEELKQINRDTLSYMLNNIREQDPNYSTTSNENNGSPTNTLQSTKPSYSRQDSILRPPEPIATVNENKQTLMNQQFSTRQKDYETMFDKKVPEKVNFSDNIDDQPISNMDELIRKHMKQREEELKIYAPQNVTPTTVVNNQLDENVDESKNSRRSLKIDSNNANITLNVDNIWSEPEPLRSVGVGELPAVINSVDVVEGVEPLALKKSVSWTDDSDTLVARINPLNPIEVETISNKTEEDTEIVELAKFLEQAAITNERLDMHYTEFESFKLIIREMSKQICQLQEDITKLQTPSTPYGTCGNTEFRGCNVAVREVTDPEYETTVKYSITAGSSPTPTLQTANHTLIPTPPE